MQSREGEGVPDDTPSPKGEASSNREEGFVKKKSDETWKEKAQREKEKLARETAGEGGRPPPEASFLALVEELSLRAMLALGQLQNPATGEVYFDLGAAKYSIDLLGVLEQKTKGNLDPTEKAALADVLHTLRLVFVQASRNPPVASDPGGLPGGGRAAPGEGPPGGPDEGKPGPKIIY